MKRRSFPLGFALVVIGVVLLLPQGAESLNPNHECAFCHDLHGATDLQLLQYTTVEALCLSCHGPGGISTLKAEVHTSGSDWRITCRECHDPHSSLDNWCPDNCNGLGTGINIKLVGSDQDGTGLAKIDTPNSGIRHVVFESRGTDVGNPTLHSFCDNDEDGNGYYDGVCDTCHTETRWHRHTSSMGNVHRHQRGRTCTNCHLHTDYFMGP